MVKFQKRLEGQLVPEWRNAYVNYKQLKKVVGQIRQQIVREQLAGNPAHGVQHKPSFNMHTTRSRGGYSLVVNQRGQPHDLLGSEAGEMYETELLGPVPWLEHEVIFFSRLDSQLNMVNNFYKIKEREFVLRSKELELQLETLVEIRGELEACKIDVQDDSEKEIDIESGENASVINDRKNGTFCVSRSKVGHAQKMLRKAFVEFYNGLTLLQNYSSLNTLAFAKILKKYDKVTGKDVMDTYLKAVEASYFSSSDKVVSLVEQVEALFTQHFSKNNRREALVRLRPSPQVRDSKKKALYLGFFTGCSWTLLLSLVLVLLTHSQIADYLGSSSFIIGAYPIFSTMALLLFHIYMYGLNLYFWKRTRINYAFIFEFAPGTELRGLEVMLLSTGLTTVFMTSVLSHVLLITSKGSVLVRDGQIIPVASFMVFLFFVALPFNIFYKSTRYYFLRCVWRIICSPFYKVKFADFFLADQFTSEITVLRNVLNISCYYVSRYYIGADSSDICSQNPAIQHVKLFVLVLPYWWRLLQCGRRWRDDRKDQSQIANGGKYISALIAVLIRLTYETRKTKLCFILYMISSSIATVYQFYWDVVMDWGLLQRKSVNPWLRDQLILKSKAPYFMSMVANAILRLAWLYSLHEVLRSEPVDHKHSELFFGMAEIARRGMWNFYRLENEHLNNVGKFRAVKTVPLPFKDIGQDG